MIESWVGPLWVLLSKYKNINIFFFVELKLLKSATADHLVS